VAKRGRPRKTRVTREQIEAAKAEKKITTYARKKRIIPGPWTKIEPKFTVNAGLRLSKGVMDEIIGSAYGSYLRDNYWMEKGWYPVVVNVWSKDMVEVIKKHGLDQFVAACERSLTSVKDNKGKQKYGTVVVLEVGANNIDKKHKDERFISLKIKTNKKNISGFRAIRKGVLVNI